MMRGVRRNLCGQNVGSQNVLDRNVRGCMSVFETYVVKMSVAETSEAIHTATSGIEGGTIRSTCRFVVRVLTQHCVYHVLKRPFSTVINQGVQQPGILHRVTHPFLVPFAAASSAI